MVDIRQAESQAANDTEHQQQQQGRSIIFGQQGGSVDGEDGGKGKEVRGALPWSDEAKEAVRGLKEEGSKDVVQLVCLSLRWSGLELVLTMCGARVNRRLT